LTAGTSGIDTVLVPVGFGGITGPASTVSDFEAYDVSCGSDGRCLIGGCQALSLQGCPFDGVASVGELVESTVGGVVTGTTEFPNLLAIRRLACDNPISSCLALAGSADGVGVLTITTSSPAPGFQASPSSITFANQKIGATSTASTITVHNTGGAPLVFTHVAIAGANPSNFVIKSNTCVGTIAAGGTCTTSVTFKPNADAKRAANVTFTDNASGSPQTVSLAGRGCLVVNGSSCT
jgi:hypothetical protein